MLHHLRSEVVTSIRTTACSYTIVSTESGCVTLPSVTRQRPGVVVAADWLGHVCDRVAQSTLPHSPLCWSLQSVRCVPSAALYCTVLPLPALLTLSQPLVPVTITSHFINKQLQTQRGKTFQHDT